MADIDTLTNRSDKSQGPDLLTAPADAVPRRRPEILTLGDCWRSFMRRPSPPLLAGAIVAAIALRVALGHYDWRDLVVAAGVIAATPIVEWLIHVYLLHAKPIRWRGQRYDLLAAREHRAHHSAPAELEGVLIPTYAVLIFLPQIAVTVWLLSFPIHLVLGGDRLAHAALPDPHPVSPAGSVLPVDLARSPAPPLQERALLVRRDLDGRRQAARHRPGSG